MAVVHSPLKLRVICVLFFFFLAGSHPLCPRNLCLQDKVGSLFRTRSTTDTLPTHWNSVPNSSQPHTGWVNERKRVRASVRLCLCLYVCVCACVCMSLSVSACLSVRPSVSASVGIRVCLCVCVCIFCVSVCVCVCFRSISASSTSCHEFVYSGLRVLLHGCRREKRVVTKKWHGTTMTMQARAQKLEGKDGRYV